MAGSSALAFSSSRRRRDLSQSKMPPQQGNGLLDIVDRAFGLGAHVLVLPAHRYGRKAMTCKDLGSRQLFGGGVGLLGGTMMAVGNWKVIVTLVHSVAVSPFSMAG